MKKIQRITGVLLFMIMLVVLMAPSAGAAGTLTVRLVPDKTGVSPGDSFSVAVNMVGVKTAGGVAVADFTVKYDSSRFSFQSEKIGGGKPAGDLSVYDSGGSIKVAYWDNKGGSNGFTSDSTLLTLKFKVKSKASKGSASFSASLGDGTFADKSQNEIKLSFSSGSIKVNEKASGNNNLSKLTVGNATIKPSFSPNVTSYTAEVDFDVEQLELGAFQEDLNAKVGFDNPSLKAGGKTKVSVVVTAADGSKKTYTITVTRAEDPESTTGGNSENTLTALKLEGGILSPVFSPNKLEYAVDMPLGTESVNITASPKDDNAEVKISGDKNLSTGVNLAVVTVTAENGDVKEYKITVTVGDVVTTLPSTQVIPTLQTPPETQAQEENSASSGFAWWWVVIAIIGGLAAGVLLEHFVLPVFDKKRQF